MNMGTLFIVTKEVLVHENITEAIVVANELDTRLVMRPLRNARADHLLAKELALGGKQVQRHQGRGGWALHAHHATGRDESRRLVVRHGGRAYP